MSTTKKYDIVCKTGEYTNNQGETKGQWKNVGAVMVGDNGPFIMMDKTFNPAGLDSGGRSSILLSLFEPKQSNQGQQSQPAQSQGPAQSQAPVQDESFDDSSIPF